MGLKRFLIWHSQEIFYLVLVLGFGVFIFVLLFFFLQEVGIEYPWSLFGALLGVPLTFGIIGLLVKLGIQR